ncbi:MAG TPA: hypothetical protein VE338_16540 [Ktedonobacterales bacterium]|jgi:hypothetical protein|nr:hypothetical protein [Ktedonobacterales bacterium]
MPQPLTAIALILSNDARDPELLRDALAVNGYAAYQLEPVDETIERTLRETRAALVLAHVDLKRDTLAQPNDVALLGFLLREPAYRERHAIVLMTRTPDVVETVLGPVLARLEVSVLTLPCSSGCVRDSLEQAHARTLSLVAAPSR